MALAKKVEHRIESLDLLRSLRDGCTPKGLDQLVELVRVVFDADFGILFDVSPDQTRCRVTAASVRGCSVPNGEQPLAGAIASEVVRRGQLFMSAGAKQRFPSDELLEKSAIEAYHAVTLVNGEGQPDGILAIAHTSRFELDQSGEFLLELLGQRIRSDWSKRADPNQRQATSSQVSAHRAESLQLPGASPLPQELLESEELESSTPPASKTRSPATDLFRRFFELGTVGMAVVGAQGEIWDVNDCLCEMLKRERSEVVRCKWTDLTCEEDLGRELSLVAELLNHRSDGYNIDKRFKLPDGMTLTTNVSVRCARDANGAIEYLALLARDVSQERLLEQQLLHSQKLEAIGRLAGGIAHDFNNLLTAMLAYTDTTEAGDEQAVSEMIVGVRDAAMRAANLTGQLLAFARRQVIEPKVLDLNQVVQSTTHLLRRIVGEDIEIVTQITQPLWRVRLYHFLHLRYLLPEHDNY